ncbi:hypothetical protein GCM10023196_105690 [Actinoallomurus vinaceus]|uniref:Uncharacterized protein n=1 Tax=Actinoallomurus vinaceus TaxID=1080074 RepID=A0ABP8UWL0_9ACTN
MVTIAKIPIITDSTASQLVSADRLDVAERSTDVVSVDIDPVLWWVDTHPTQQTPPAGGWRVGDVTVAANG